MQAKQSITKPGHKQPLFEQIIGKKKMENSKSFKMTQAFQSQATLKKDAACHL